MKRSTYSSALLSLRPDIVKVLLAILVTAGSHMTYAQPCVTEVCNEIDDDCDGLVDEGVQTRYYLDWDGDGTYNFVTILACTPPPGGWVEGPQFCPDCCFDYDDYNGEFGCADGGELCNGIDDDGNGLIDDDDPGLFGAVWWYADSDGDGYGDPNYSVYSCTQPTGYVSNPQDHNIDCDDTNPAIHVNCNNIDTDCDGVPDNLDVCPGGDDSIDNNADGIADCSQLLNYNDYSTAWHCGANKIYVCHNDNNPQTICIDFNALLPAHYNHGDAIGPCTSCPQNLIAPDISDASEDVQSMVSEQTDATFHDSAHPFHNQVDDKVNEVLSVKPNPADNYIEVQTTLSLAVITVMDVSGKVVIRQAVSGDNNFINTVQLTEGIYFLRMQNGVDCLTRSIVVMH